MPIRCSTAAMSSGFGVHGGPGRCVGGACTPVVAFAHLWHRVATLGVSWKCLLALKPAPTSPALACSCYPIWMDFSECMSKTEDPKACKDFRDDYLECLHHRKEVRRPQRRRRRWCAARCSTDTDKVNVACPALPSLPTARSSPSSTSSSGRSGGSSMAVAAAVAARTAEATRKQTHCF